MYFVSFLYTNDTSQLKLSCEFLYTLKIKLVSEDRDIDNHLFFVLMLDSMILMKSSMNTIGREGGELFISTMFMSKILLISVFIVFPGFYFSTSI